MPFELDMPDFLFIAKAQNLCRRAGDNRIFWHITSNNRSGAHNRVRADLNSRQNAGIHSDISSEADPHWLDDQLSGDDRHAHRLRGVSRAENLRSRSPAYIVFEDKVTSIEVSLRPNPNVIANAAISVKPSLDHGLRSDKNRIAKLHGLRMLEHNRGRHLQIVSYRLAKRAHDDPPHQAIEGTLARPKLPEHFN